MVRRQRIAHLGARSVRLILKFIIIVKISQAINGSAAKTFLRELLAVRASTICVTLCRGLPWETADKHTFILLYYFVKKGANYNQIILNPNSDLELFG